MKNLVIDVNSLSFKLAKFGEMPRIQYDDDLYSPEYTKLMREKFSSCSYWYYVMCGTCYVLALFCMGVFVLSLVTDFLTWVVSMIKFGMIIEPGVGATITAIFIILMLGLISHYNIDKYKEKLGIRFNPSKIPGVNHLSSFIDSVKNKICTKVVFIDSKVEKHENV